MVNKVILVGNLGRDPEVRQAGGQIVAILRLATSRSWIDKRSGQRREEREWHDVEAWGRYGELCGQYLAKGRQVYVAGRLKTDRWKDKQTGQDRPPCEDRRGTRPVPWQRRAPRGQWYSPLGCAFRSRSNGLAGGRRGCGRTSAARG